MRKLTKRSCHIIDMTRIAYATFGVGIAKYNPRKCLACGQPIKRGESWRRDASAADPDGHGRVVIVRHSPRCPDQKSQGAFQKMLTKRSGGNPTR